MRQPKLKTLKRWFDPKSWIVIIISGILSYLVVGLISEKFNINSIVALTLYFLLGLLFMDIISFIGAIIRSLVGAYRLTRFVINKEEAMYKENEDKIIEKFEKTIKKHEDQLFGIYLYVEEIKLLYRDNEQIIETTDYHFKKNHGKRRKGNF